MGQLGPTKKPCAECEQVLIDLPMTRVALIRLDLLNANVPKKPRGYLAAYHAAGRIDGNYLVIPWAEYSDLQLRFGGWGDRLHRWLKPTVKILDSRFGTRLADCGGCVRRRRKLNRIETWLKRRLAPLFQTR